VPRRNYKIVLLDADGKPVTGAQYVHASDRTPAPGLCIDLPSGRWYVHEVVATHGGDRSAQLVEVSHYGGTLICRPEPALSRPERLAPGSEPR